MCELYCEKRRLTLQIYAGLYTSFSVGSVEAIAALVRCRRAHTHAHYTLVT